MFVFSVWQQRCRSEWQWVCRLPNPRWSQSPLHLLQASWQHLPLWWYVQEDPHSHARLSEGLFTSSQVHRSKTQIKTDSLRRKTLQKGKQVGWSGGRWRGGVSRKAGWSVRRTDRHTDRQGTGWRKINIYLLFLCCGKQFAFLMLVFFMYTNDSCTFWVTSSSLNTLLLSRY